MVLAGALALALGGWGQSSMVVGLAQPTEPRPLAGVAAITARVPLRQSYVLPVQVHRGASGDVIVLVPVTINGKGPYTFALDTGATQSVVDAQVARELGLSVVSSAAQISGVTGSITAPRMWVSNWRIGQLQLPQSTVVALHLPPINGQMKMQGLLGSDVLSQYGAFTLDYEQRRLEFPARAIGN